MPHRLILDHLTGDVLDASTDEVLIVEIPDDQIDLDLIESMVNNWSIRAVSEFADAHGWNIRPLFDVDAMSQDELLARYIDGAKYIEPQTDFVTRVAAIMDKYGEVPIVNLPGSEGWTSAYEFGGVLDKRFPGQDADQFAYAMEYNSYGPAQDSYITDILMIEQGEHDAARWV